MDQALAKVPDEQFESPLVENSSELKPVLKSIWQGGVVATPTNGTVVATGGVHSILHWVDKNDPRGPIPENPQNDSQYERWEYGVRLWAEQNNLHYDNPYILGQ